MKAIWNNTIIAEGKTIVIEGNHYFPAKTVKQTFLTKNGETYTCPWKGVCDYYDITVGGQVLEGAAFSYPEPKEAAKEIAGHFAFWKGVDIHE